MFSQFSEEGTHFSGKSIPRLESRLNNKNEIGQVFLF